MKKLSLASAFTLAAAAGFAAALLTSHGCASNCANNCPSSYVYIGDTDNMNLDIQYVIMNGPACQPYGYGCAGDSYSTTCTHVNVTPVAAGICDVTIFFGDRDTEVVHLEFEPVVNKPGMCCGGFQVIGPSVYTIPVSPSGGPITPLDGGPNDAVTVIPDASADAQPDARTDAGTDAKTDATPD